MEALRTATHVLKTMSERRIEVLSFNAKNEIIGRFAYQSRKGAISAIERMVGKPVTLKPMQTTGAERVSTQVDLPDIINVEE